MAQPPDDGRPFLPDPWRGGPARRALLLTGALGAAVVVVIGLLTVRGRPWWSPDRSLSREVFDAGLRHPALSTAAEWAGHLTVPTVLRVVTLLGAVLLWRRGRREAAVWWPATMLVAGALAIGVRYAVARPRPRWPGSGPPVEGYTFPSGHTANAAAFAACLVVLAWRYRGPLARAAAAVFGAVLLVGVAASRVVLGVHSVSDVLAAWALAAAVLPVMLAAAAAPAVRGRLPARVTRSGGG